MPIVPSRSREVQKLIAQLGAGGAAERESAVAQLTLLGGRAVPPLLVALRSATQQVRLGAVAALEAIRDPRALAGLVEATGEADPALAGAAVDAAASFAAAAAVEALRRVVAPGSTAAAELRSAAVRALARLHRAGRVDALDVLLERLMDGGESLELRLGALDAVADLDPVEMAPLIRRLAETAPTPLAARVRALGAVGARPAANEADMLLARLLESPTRPDVARGAADALRTLGPGAVESIHRALDRTEALLPLRTLAEVLGHLGAPASIPVLHRLLGRLAERQHGDDAPAIAEVRAAVHLALAALDSRIALYDLRESLLVRPPQATGRLLEAAARIGDASVVAAIAALAHDERALFDPCARALGAIAARERLTPRSRALRAVAQRHRVTLAALWERARRDTA